MRFIQESELLELMSQTDTAKKIVRSEYFIRASESDPKDQAHINVLFSLCQEAANFGASSASLGAESIVTSGAVWIVSRMSVRIAKLPHWREQVRIYTWQSGMDRINFFRDFALYTGDGELLGAARSGWNLVSIDEHKLISPKSILSDESNPWLLDLHSFDGEPLRLRANFADFSDATSFHKTPGYSDIDRNGHVNNTHYVAMCRDMADKIGVTGALASVDINYVSEVLKGQSTEILGLVSQGDPAGNCEVAVKGICQGNESFRALLGFRED